MMRAAMAAATLLLAGCASPGSAPTPSAPKAAAKAPAVAAPAGPRPFAIANPGFEAGMKPGGRCAVGWDCTMHLNPDSFKFSVAESGAASGARSLCIERVQDEPWALLTQAFENPALRGRTVRLSMAVRVEGVTGAGAGPWLLAQGRPHRNASRLAKGTTGWQRLSVELAIPPETLVVEMGATLEGPGKACFDDVRVELLSH